MVTISESAEDQIKYTHSVDINKKRIKNLSIFTITAYVKYDSQINI